MYEGVQHLKGYSQKTTNKIVPKSFLNILVIYETEKPRK